MQQPDTPHHAKTPYDEAQPAAPQTEPQADAVEDPTPALAAAQAELARLREDGLRERAELENLRRRLTRDLEQARRFANERLLSELLPVFDSLEAGLASATEASPLRDGLELTLRQLRKVASDHGLTVVDPAGEAFDPQQHQAIGMVDGQGQAPNTVVQVAQRGYVLNERLLRPALVMVARDA